MKTKIKKYVKPSVEKIELEQLDVMLASGFDGGVLMFDGYDTIWV